MYGKVIYTAHPAWHNIVDVPKFQTEISDFLKDFFDQDVCKFEYNTSNKVTRFHPADMYQFYATTEIEELPVGFYTNAQTIYEWHRAIQYFIRQYTKENKIEELKGWED